MGQDALRIDLDGVRRVATELDEISASIGQLGSPRLGFTGGAAGRVCRAEADAVRAALDTVVVELARWSLAAAGIATGMRAEAARYAAVDQAAIPATEDI